MTFSEKVKNELCRLDENKPCCQMSEAYGMALFGKSFRKDSVSLHTINREVAERYADRLVCLTGSIVTITEVERSSSNDKILYIVEIEDEIDRQTVLEYFSRTDDCTDAEIHFDLLQNDCCKRAFLRGCFLTCSSITDPEKEYHLEFVVPNDRLSDDLLTLMNDIGIHAKATKRKGINIIYLKESENIEDLLTLMGAMKSTLELMNVKIYKDVRNKVNRVTNCETANIGKTVVASSNQIKDIEWIAEHEGLDYLPDELRQVAELRLDNPELSLSELCEISNTGLTKSGMNHRFKKITEIADNLRKTSVK